MRVLFLTCDRPDYTADALYVGLSRVLGPDNVVDYPYKESFHDSAAAPWYITPRPGRRYERDEILQRLREGFFDLVCMASFRKEGIKTCRRLHAEAPFPATVFVDGSDYPHIRHDVAGAFPVGVYFKRDYVWKMGHPLRDAWGLAKEFRGKRRLFARTAALPLSLDLQTVPAFDGIEKNIDVSYRGLASHPRRPKAMQLLTDMDDISFSGAIYTAPRHRAHRLKAGRFERAWSRMFDDSRAPEYYQTLQLSPEEHSREIASSKIAVCLRGLGATKSLRYYEIVALGSMLLSDAPESVIPNDFEDRTHAVFCQTDLRDLPDLVRYYLRNESERELIVEMGRKHLLKYHTCERRAEYFLDVCARSL